MDSKHTNWEMLNNALTDTDWDNCFLKESPDEVIDCWLDKLQSVMISFIAIRRIKVTGKDKSWIIQRLKNCIQRRHRSFKKAKLFNTPLLWQKCTDLSVECNNIIKDAKRDYFTNLFGDLNDPAICKKKWWKLVKSTYGGKDKSPVPDLVVNDELIQDTRLKCEVINEYFVKQSSLDDSDAELPEITVDCPLFELPIITPDNVKKVLNYLDVSKATGPDLISNETLKLISPGISAPLSRLFNFSLEKGTFPRTWKTAHVCPIYKKWDKSKVESYRPISLLCNISKVFERIVVTYIQEHL
jgi:hypothetical protein